MLQCANMQKVITPVNVEGRAKLGIRAGDTVRVTQNIVELKKGKGADKKEKVTKNTRKQVFEGLVISMKHGTEPGAPSKNYLNEWCAAAHYR